MKKLVSCLTISIFIALCQTASLCSYPYYKYIVPKANSKPNVNGSLSEWGKVWSTASSRPLSFHATSSAGITSWSNWVPGSYPYDAWVVWKAVWINNTIYTAVIVFDDNLNSQIDSAQRYDQDDSVHWWLESITNIASPSWGANDRNYLVHNNISNSFFVDNLSGTFTSIPNNGTGKFLFSSVKPSAWVIESGFLKTDVNPNSSYSPKDCVWFEITYNDADPSSGNDLERRLAWNTRGSNSSPRNRLGALILGNSSTHKKHYAKGGPVVSTSSRKTKKDTSKILLSKMNESSWEFLTEYEDVAPVWSIDSVFSNQDSIKFFLELQAYDDVRIDTYSDDSTWNPVNDDSWIILADIDSNQTYEPSTDLNILITSNFDRLIYEHPGDTLENYGTDSQREIPVKFDSLVTSDSSGNWYARLEITLPPYFINSNCDSSLRFELLYNDNDGEGRERQIAWNTTAEGYEPWWNFKNMGKIIELRSFSTSSVNGHTFSTPKTFSLLQNYPNPFNPATTITFDVGRPSNIKIVIYDILGREVRQLTDRKFTAGRHSEIWNGTDNVNSPAASGVYFVRMEADEFVSVKKILLVR